MKNIILRPLKHFSGGSPVAYRYMLDGLLIGSASNIAGAMHNLYAVRLGASDYQLSLVFFLPQMFNLLVLLPGGIFIGSLHNKKKMILATIMMIMAGYFLCSLSPFSGGYAIYFYLVSISLVSGANAWYNIAWQSYFPEIVEVKSRNRILTLRMYVFMFASMLAPLFVGAILAYFKTNNVKIIMHQLLFLLAVLVYLVAVYNFNKFKTVITEIPKRISLLETKKAFIALFHNKKFLLFAGVALFFHLTWHIDWTLYFIGQVEYLRMNEFQVTLVMVVQTAAQLLTLRFWSRINERHGVTLPFIFGILGLSLCPVSMFIAVSLPASIGPHAFLLFHMIASLSVTVVSLNLFQCLLQVVDEEYRSFTMSVFASIICLSNAIMPVAGVALYHLLGANLDGFRYTFAIVFSLRIVAAGLWFLRWKYMKKHEA